MVYNYIFSSLYGCNVGSCCCLWFAKWKTVMLLGWIVVWNIRGRYPLSDWFQRIQLQIQCAEQELLAKRQHICMKTKCSAWLQFPWTLNFDWKWMTNIHTISSLSTHYRFSVSFASNTISLSVSIAITSRLECSQSCFHLYLCDRLIRIQFTRNTFTGTSTT